MNREVLAADRVDEYQPQEEVRNHGSAQGGIARKYDIGAEGDDQSDTAAHDDFEPGVEFISQETAEDTAGALQEIADSAQGGSCGGSQSVKLLCVGGHISDQSIYAVSGKDDTDQNPYLGNQQTFKEPLGDLDDRLGIFFFFGVFIKFRTPMTMTTMEHRRMAAEAPATSLV